jgi:hypothetical protein
VENDESVFVLVYRMVDIEGWVRGRTHGERLRFVDINNEDSLDSIVDN